LVFVELGLVAVVGVLKAETVVDVIDVIDVVLKTEAYVKEPPQVDVEVRLVADIDFFFDKLFENHFRNFELIVFNGSAEKKAEQLLAIARTRKKMNKNYKF
jgi:hypothetical protein